ncbi:hypothetical protein H2O64_08890 [Kordia sp. YSTF-M3]|uniref:Natural product n=1 Tax=Kordia aestuariivivens TaxID=2759037 RepID=A0ABR7Q8A7_9FLAO|nr:hypothetical protein [Kordia aestuariivivens]MBC8754785.1 hypothetical protein [Kordia aestuariivivens]
MLQKILNLTGVNMLGKTEQVNANGGNETFTDSSFMCYCNSIFIGEKSSVKECWKTC